MISRRPRSSPLFPYTTLFRSRHPGHHRGAAQVVAAVDQLVQAGNAGRNPRLRIEGGCGVALLRADRKSTRLNSSHSQISYAVFCLKKKRSVEDVAQSLPATRT